MGSKQTRIDLQDRQQGIRHQRPRQPELDDREAMRDVGTKHGLRGRSDVDPSRRHGLVPCWNVRGSGGDTASSATRCIAEETFLLDRSHDLGIDESLPTGLISTEHRKHVVRPDAQSVVGQAFEGPDVFLLEQIS